MALVMAAETPEKYLAEMSKERRKGRIFIDYLRNGRGATAIEYAIIAGGISIVIVATVSAVGLMLRTNYFEPILAALVG